MQHFGVRKLTGIIELTPCRNVCFHSFSRKHFLATKFGFALFLPGPYAFLVGPYAFSRPYHFDAYGPHTGPFYLWFSKEIARVAVRFPAPPPSQGNGSGNEVGSYDNCFNLHLTSIRKVKFCKKNKNALEYNVYYRCLCYIRNHALD